MDDGGSSALLLNIIQLTVLIVGLLAAGKLVMSGNAMTAKIAGATQGLAKRFGAEKGLNAVRSGAATGVKNKALNTEARMARQADGTIRNRIGGLRSRRKFKKESQAGERQRVMEDHIGDYYGGPTQIARDRRATAAGVGGAAGADRVAAQADAVQRKRNLEELERRQLPQKEVQQAIAAAAAELKAHPNYAQDGNGVAEAALTAALAANDGAGVRAALAHLSSSADGVRRTHQVIENAEAAGTMTASRRADIAAGVDDNWTDFKTKDVAVTAWATDPATPPMTATATAGGTYRGLNAEQFATQTPQAAAAAVATGGISPTMAQAVLDAPSQSKLTDATRAIFEAHAATAPPPPPPPPPPSDRRLKKNITFLGTKNTVPLYSFEYVWSSQRYVGTMAQDIINTHPAAVSTGRNGYYRVDYSQLGFSMTTYDKWETDNL